MAASPALADRTPQVETDSPHFDGLARQAELLAEGETSSSALVEDALERAARSQQTLNPFRVIRDEGARADAVRADERLASGERLPLLGVPVAIKDDMDLAGHPTAFGCDGEFECKQDDGEAVRRLREAGAVVVGKTNSPEFGQYPITEGAAFGVTRNPWNVEHTPGGSSGGSAAAVAAGVVPGAVGSDGAGSVRIPAAWCGLVGIKPQRGRVSTWPDVDAFNGLACFGPLTRNVGDAALMLDVLSGNHPDDLHRPPAPRTPFADAVKREPGQLRIALSFKHPFSAAPVSLDPEIRRSLEQTAEKLSGLGHDVIELDPDYKLIGFHFLPRSLGGLPEWHDRVPDASLLDPRTHDAVRVGKLLRGLPLKVVKRLEPRLQRRIGSTFQHVDVVLTPTSASKPFPVGAIDGLGGWATDQFIAGGCPYSWAWNVLGWPGMSVPSGVSEDGLPIGAQLLGRPSDEGTLISLAAQLEEVERWQDKVPPHVI